MANRYWVGGAGYWDTTSTTNWSATSGGSAGASAPTSSDNVFLDANSGGSFVFYNIANCANLDCTGFTGTLANGVVSSPQLNVYGNLTLSASMTWSANAGLYLRGTGSQTINTNGKSMDEYVYIDTTGSYTLNSAMTCVGLYINSGTFSTNGYSLTVTNYLQATTAGTATLNFGTSTVTVSNYITITAGGSFTLNAGTSTLNASNISTGSTARTFYNVASSSGFTFSGNLTVNNLTIASGNLVLGGDITISGTLAIPNGSSPMAPVFWTATSTTRGTQHTATINAISGSLSYQFFSDVKVLGAVAPLSGTYFGNLGNNSGITFSSPVTYYWVSGTATFSPTANFATSSGGAAVATVLLPQDSVVFDDNSGGAGTTVSVNPGTMYLTSITATARTTTMTLSMSTSATRMYVLGDVKFSSVCSLTGAAPSSNDMFISFYGRITQDFQASIGTISIPIQIYNYSASVRLLNSITISRAGVNFTNAVEHYSGVFNTNGYTLTLTGQGGRYNGNFGNSIGTRTLALGTTTLSAYAFNFGTASKITITGTGTLEITGTGSAFNGGNGNYFPTVNCYSTSIVFNGSNRFVNITNSYKSVGAAAIRFTTNTVNTFDSFSLAGEATRICTLSATPTTARANLVLSSGAPIDAGSTSTDAGNNTGVLFTGAGPSGYLSVSYINSSNPQNGFLMF